MRRAPVGQFVLTCAMHLLSTAAHAEPATPRTSSLSWVRTSGAESCVSTPVLARSVEERLRRPVFVSAADASVSVEGLVQRTDKPAGWTATLTLRDAKGEPLGTRELHRDGADCHALDASLSLVIAVMIDPDAKADEPAPESPGPPPPVTRTVIQKQIVLVALPEKPKPTPWCFDGGAAAALLVGPLPGVAFGAQAHALLEPPRWPALEGFGMVVPQSSKDAPGGTGSVAFSLGLLGGGVCPLRHHGDRFHAYGCLQGQIGVLRASSSGFAAAAPASYRLVLASAVEARATYRVVGPFTVRAGLGLGVPWLRHRFVYEDAAGNMRELHRIAPVALQADLGMGVIFP